MEYLKPEASDETMSTSLSSNELHYEKTPTSSSVALETSGSSHSENVYRDPPPPQIGDSIDSSFEVSVADASNPELGMAMEGTHSSSTEKKGGYVSPTSYLHNLVNGEAFSTGLPPPPILLETRIGSENSAFSSVSGGMLRPLPSKLATPDRSQTPSDHSSGREPIVTPSPVLSQKIVQHELHMESPEEPAVEPVVRTGPQRRLQLFERASRLANRARKKKSLAKEAPKKETETSEEQPTCVSDESAPSFSNISKVVTEAEPTIAVPEPRSSPPPQSPTHEIRPISPQEPQNVPVTDASRDSSLPLNQPDVDEEENHLTEASSSRPPHIPLNKNMKLDAAPPAVKAKYARASPLARMRSDRAQEAAAMSPEAIAEAEAAAARAAKIFEKQQKTEEEIVAETHRRWRRSLQQAKRKQKKKMEGEGSEKKSVLPQVARVACDTDHKILSVIKYEFQNLLASGCGSMQDIISIGDSFDDDSMMSEDTYSSYENDTETEDDVDRRGRSRRPRNRLSREPSDDLSDVELKQKVRSWEKPFDECSDSVIASSAAVPTGSRPESRNSAVKNADVEINDKNFINAFIDEASQEGMSFIWHKEAKSSKSLTQPLTVRLCLKLGHKGTDGKLVGPRLAWNDCNIDLFDIRSVEKSSAVQMQNYPFAIPGNSFFVRKNDGKDYAFEASNDEEARRFIHGLRWLVARLAFNLIIGNREVSCELMSLLREEGQLAESEESKAMNDVTNHLVKKIVFHSMEM